MPVRALLLLVALTACSASGPDPVPVSPAAVTIAPTVSPPAVVPAPAPALLEQPAQGGDASWPQCPKGTPGALPGKQPKGLPLPGPEADFVVLGLTNGPGFYPNPCLAWQVTQARARGQLLGAYGFITLPTVAQQRRYGGLVAAARAQAQVNLQTLRRAGLRVPLIWVDVEPQAYLAPWGDDVRANRLTVLTIRDTYRAAGYRVGFYSSDNPWREITGGLRVDDPVWVTVGPRGRAAAVAKCAAPTFSGGPAVLAQWWDDDTADLDLVCPGVRDPRSLFGR